MHNSTKWNVTLAEGIAIHKSWYCRGKGHINKLPATTLVKTTNSFIIIKSYK